jgi:hypothetical protein
MNESRQKHKLPIFPYLILMTSSIELKCRRQNQQSRISIIQIDSLEFMITDEKVNPTGYPGLVLSHSQFALEKNEYFHKRVGILLRRFLHKNARHDGGR